jgi:tRNA (guanosine-2'-O-)-methyltransferase
MRRRTAGVVGKDDLDARVVRAESYDPDDVVRILEPYVTEGRRARMKEVIARRLASVAVAFDRPYDPHNGAAVLRSCEAFGVQQLHIIEREGTPFAAARSVARGAEKWLDLSCHRSLGSFLSWADSAAMTLVATHPQGELEPDDLSRISRLALVLGNEREGIRPELGAACSLRVRIGMRGFVESLNVSVTAAVLLHAATRGRAGDLPPKDRRRLYARGLFLSHPRAREILASASRAASAQPRP